MSMFATAAPSPTQPFLTHPPYMGPCENFSVTYIRHTPARHSLLPAAMSLWSCRITKAQSYDFSVTPTAHVVESYHLICMLIEFGGVQFGANTGKIPAAFLNLSSPE